MYLVEGFITTHAQLMHVLSFHTITEPRAFKGSQVFGHEFFEQLLPCGGHLRLHGIALRR